MKPYKPEKFHSEQVNSMPSNKKKNFKKRGRKEKVGREVRERGGRGELKEGKRNRSL